MVFLMVVVDLNFNDYKKSLKVEITGFDNGTMTCESLKTTNLKKTLRNNNQ